VKSSCSVLALVASLATAGPALAYTDQFPPVLSHQQVCERARHDLQEAKRLSHTNPGATILELIDARGYSEFALSLTLHWPYGCDYPK
jgi:hypothetical protein